MRIRGILPFAAGVMLFFFAPLFAEIAAGAFLPPREGPTGEKHRPVVEAIAAQNEIREGHMYKIYVRASDPDGDLDKIHVSFSQTGGGPSAPDLLVVKKTAKLNGYILVWARLEGTARQVSTVQADVEIRVEDRAGNMSEPKTLDFEVGDFNKKDRFSPPAGFNRRKKLGQAEFRLVTEDELVGDEKFK